MTFSMGVYQMLNKNKRRYFGRVCGILRCYWEAFLSPLLIGISIISAFALDSGVVVPFDGLTGG